MRRKTMAIALAAALLPGFAGAGSPGSPEQAVRAGNALYAAGRYEAARGRYGQALAALPDSAEVHFDLGAALFKLLDSPGARGHFAHAALAADPALKSRAKYNLGALAHQDAVTAMRTFQDAATPLKAAIALYRESLALDPDFADARYNLELAHRLLGELDRQRVQAQLNPEVRNQRTSPNRGQAFDPDPGGARAGERDARQDAATRPEGSEAPLAPGNLRSTEGAARIQQAAAPERMTPDEAERLVEIARERARSDSASRRDRQRAHLRDAAEDRIW